MALTYRELLRQIRTLAREVRKDTEEHKKLADALNGEARDTGRIAEQIASLKVDASTVAETREVARIMQGVSDSALSYANAADEASRSAQAAENQLTTEHGGIQQAVDSSPVSMAERTWYGQE